MKQASIILTLFNPFMFLRQICKSSDDSNSASTHGGLLYLLHSLQWNMMSALGMPSVISISDLRQLIHVFA